MALQRRAVLPADEAAHRQPGAILGEKGLGTHVAGHWPFPALFPQRHQRADVIPEVQEPKLQLTLPQVVC